MADVSAATFLGRDVERLRPPYRAQDKAFAAARLDGQTLQDADFKHCTFANVSFKDVEVQGGAFIDCVFIGCYFRNAVLKSSKFVGCRFIDCNFNRVAVMASDFRYSTFRGCQIPFEELEPSLPPEPNLKEDLTRNLYLESSRLGLSSDARRYRSAEIRAKEKNLRAAALGSTKWYRDHFEPAARVQAAVAYGASLANRWLWGYGERAIVLVWNVLLLSLLVFPFAYWLVQDGFAKPGGTAIDGLDLVRFSVATMLPGGVESGLEAVALLPQVLATAEALFGLLAVALFASYIFRWSLHR